MLTLLDNCIKEFFQRDVQFTLKNNPYKKGKLINFKQSGCYLSFILQTEKKRETFEIPFPFMIKKEGMKVTFDYQLVTLSEQNFNLLINLKTVTQIKNCKFYNAILTIALLS